MKTNLTIVHKPIIEVKYPSHKPKGKEEFTVLYKPSNCIAVFVAKKHNWYLSEFTVGDHDKYKGIDLSEVEFIS